MGLLSDSLRALIPERKQAMAAAIPTWDVGRQMSPPSDYARNAREGYMLDEIVFDCVEIRATSAGEPPICAYRANDEKLDEHPAITLLNNPNPFMGRSRFWATISMCLDIGGNAYIEKVRSGAGKVVELWLLRPDRVRVIPDARTYVGGYSYMVGDQAFTLRAEDVIHFKTRHPLDDYYGLPPLAVLAGRVDLDVWARRFTESFFRNAGVPAGLLNIVKTMTEQERESTRQRFRELYGGPESWHRLMVIDGGQASYSAMGLPLGAEGLAMPELNQINETRICGAFGVAPSLVPTMAGLNSSSYANRVSDRELFWESTMIPLFTELDSALTAGLASEFADIDRLEHDFSRIKALQEDEDKKHARLRDDFKAGILTWQEARTLIGEPPEPEEPGIVLVAANMVPTWSDDMLKEPEAMPAPALPSNAPTGEPATPPPPAPAVNGQRNGSSY
jgi:HK97 family phage portal protein